MEGCILGVGHILEIVKDAFYEILSLQEEITLMMEDFIQLKLHLIGQMNMGCIAWRVM